MKGYLKDLSASKKLYVMCWIAYSVSYIGRYNYTSVIAQLVGEGLFTKSETGFISMVYFFCYGIGQLINGLLGDKLSPYKMIFSGLFLSSIANFIMPFAKTTSAMSVVWGINGLSQSMLWAPVLVVISSVLAKEYRSKAIFYVSFTVPVGTIAAYVLTLILLSVTNWKSVFTITSGILMAVAFLWAIISKQSKKKLVFEETEDEMHNKEDDKTNSNNMKIALVISSIVFILLPTMFHGMLRDGVTTWVPTMLTEKYETAPSFSLLLTILLPVVNLTGVFACTFLYEKYFHNAVKTALVFFIFSAIPICVLMFIGKINMLLAVLMFALITTSMNAANHMIMTVFPMEFAKVGRVSTVTGLLNSATYMGGALSAYVFGWIAEIYSWETTIVFWLMIAAVSVAFLVVEILRKKKTDI